MQFDFNPRYFNTHYRNTLEFTITWLCFLLKIITNIVLPFLLSTSPSNFIVWAKVASGSMTPNLKTHDITLATKYDFKLLDIFNILTIFFSDFFAYNSWLAKKFPILLNSVIHFKTIQRGDIITFLMDKYQGYYTKRIIGMPGDTIEIYHGFVIINGQRLQYEYVGSFESTENYKLIKGDLWKETAINGISYDVLYINGIGNSQDTSDKIVIPENHVYVMGDNRHDSADGRSMVEPVHMDLIVNNVPFILLSNSQFTTLHPVKWIKGIRTEFSGFFTNVTQV